MYLTPGMRDLLVQRGALHWTVTGVFTPSECQALMARMEALGPELAPVTTAKGPVVRTDIRTNARVMFDDADLAQVLLGKIAHALPQAIDGRALVGLNERFRGYRYGPGQAFKPHLDGSVQLGNASSELTLLVYLNDGCEGGETRFLFEPQVSVCPQQGTALLFAHRVLHEGVELRAGLKWALRTDVMYAASFRAASPKPDG
jgi:prolyl 4-hydroxylase